MFLVINKFISLLDVYLNNTGQIKTNWWNSDRLVFIKVFGRSLHFESNAPICYQQKDCNLLMIETVLKVNKFANSFFEPLIKQVYTKCIVSHKPAGKRDYTLFFKIKTKQYGEDQFSIQGQLSKLQVNVHRRY